MRTCRSILFLILISAGFPVVAQLYAPDRSACLKAGYASNTGNDSVYIFHRPAFKETNTITLRAESVDGTTGWSFIWSLYNTNTREYDIIPKADAGSSSTIDTISVFSGYRVIMTKGAVSDTFRAWILFDDFDVTVTNKDAADTVLAGYRDCKSVTLISDTIIFPLSYPEPGTGNTIYIKNNYTFQWKADKEESDDPSGVSFIGRIYNPPYKDTWYMVTVTDNFKLARIDSVFCPAITSKPNLTFEHVKLSDPLEYPDKLYQYYYDVDALSAPGKFRFDFSKSEHSIWYKLDFGDTLNYIAETDTAVIVHEYEKPGEYTAKLYTLSPEPYSCPDSVVLEKAIVLDHVTEDIIKLPNVFSPNGDMNNDVEELYIDNNIFRSYGEVSVFDIEITIVDRIGKKVHYYSGNMRDWEGWNGNVMGSNREAPNGVYYYCLTVQFFGTTEENPLLHHMEVTKKGFIHLYREN
jgi:hypothetical protein